MKNPPRNKKPKSNSPARAKTTSRARHEKDARKRALRVLAQARRGQSLAKAARAARIKPATVRKYLPNQFHQAAPGKPWKPISSDRLSAVMNIVTPTGPIGIPVRGSKERSLLGRYNIALRNWRNAKPGAEAALAAFKGKRVAGQELITEVRLLAVLEDAQQIDFDELYSSFSV